MKKIHTDIADSKGFKNCIFLISLSLTFGEGLQRIHEEKMSHVAGTAKLPTASAESILKAVSRVNKSMDRVSSARERNLHEGVSQLARDIDTFAWDHEKILTKEASELFVLVILSDGVGILFYFIFHISR